MQSSDIQARMSNLVDEVSKYYADMGRKCAVVGSLVRREEIYAVDFLIDRKLIIRCQMPIDKINYTSALLIGIGPCFVHPMHLMEYKEASRYSMNDDYEFILRNLSLFDEHLASGLLQLVNITGA